jgi:hypothetical protein
MFPSTVSDDLSLSDTVIVGPFEFSGDIIGVDVCAEFDAFPTKRMD